MRSSPAWMRIGACISAIVASGGAVSAQTPPASVADCHRIAASAQRLACYDAVSGRTAGARTAAEPAAGAAPRAPAAQTQYPQASVRTPSAKLSMIDEAWGFDASSPRYLLGVYRSNYLLVAQHTDRVNNRPFTPLFEAAGVPPQDLDNTEAMFQLSFKARLWTTDDRRWGLWTAYTQASHWQVYNSDDLVSKPFRETNYMPEAFVTYRPGIALPGGFRWTLLKAGYNHQSNGRSSPLSRSWDRIIAEVGVERDNLALFAKAWYRINESAHRDDNPDITDYMGHAELSGLYRWGEHTFTLSGRGNLNTGKGAGELTWTSPRLLGPLRGYVRVFSGYGESLIDYNWKQTTIGVGIAINSGL